MGASSADLRRLALALPGSVEADHHGFPSFRVGGKIFATHPDPEHAHVMLDADDTRAAVEQLDGCEELHWGKRLVGVRVELARVKRAVLADLLHSAWELRAARPG